jgi:hypothetical protein
MLRDWAQGLGQETFVGTSGRVFPTVMKASPLLRAWLARLEAQAKQPISTLALHREIARMVASIHCDHSKPELPDAIAKWRQTNASHLPLRFKLIEGRMIVIAGALPKGAEITAINGRQVSQILNAVAPLVAYDGETDQAIAVKIADDSDLGGSDLEEYWLWKASKHQSIVV